MEIQAVSQAPDYRAAVIAAFELATQVGDAREASALVEEVRPILRQRLAELEPELDPPETFACVWALHTLLTLDRLKTSALRDAGLDEWHELAAEALSTMHLMRAIEGGSPRQESAGVRHEESDTGP